MNQPQLLRLSTAALCVLWSAGPAAAQASCDPLQDVNCDIPCDPLLDSNCVPPCDPLEDPNCQPEPCDPQQDPNCQPEPCDPQQDPNCQPEPCDTQQDPNCQPEPCDPQQDPNCQPEPETPPNNPVDGRLCSSEQLFLDVPPEAIWWNTAGFEPLRIDLETYAKSRAQLWFCAEGAIGPFGGCLDRPAYGADIRVEMFRVMDERTHPARLDGHQRFARFRFHEVLVPETPDTPEETRPLAFAPEAACDLVSTFRGLALTNLTPQAVSDIRVGRECDISTAQAADAPWTDPAFTQHLDQIGATPSGEIGKPGKPRVHIAMIDTPVERLVQKRLGVRQETSDPLIPLTRDARGQAIAGFPHGALVALLMRQIAPTAKIISHPAFATGGSAPIWAVARAVDNALFDPKVVANRPLIVNLSLGFRPELLAPTRLRGDINTSLLNPAVVVFEEEAGKFSPPLVEACETWEDGAGTPLRYALLVARELDRGRDPTGRGLKGNGTLPAAGGPVNVVASAGNFTRPLGEEDFEVIGDEAFEIANDPLHYPCEQLVSVEFDRRLFYPAQWGLEPGTASQCGPLAVAVGAVNNADLPSVIGRFGAEPPLVAPGENLTAWAGEDWADRAPARPAPACDALPPPGPKPSDAEIERLVLESPYRFYLPYSVTGTSGSAALVSAAMARVESTRRSLNRQRKTWFERPRPGKLPALSGAGLAGLVYLTGAQVPTVERSPRVDAAGDPLRDASGALLPGVPDGWRRPGTYYPRGGVPGLADYSGALVRRLDIGRLDEALRCGVPAGPTDMTPAQLDAARRTQFGRVSALFECLNTETADRRIVAANDCAELLYGDSGCLADPDYGTAAPTSAPAALGPDAVETVCAVPEVDPPVPCVSGFCTEEFTEASTDVLGAAGPQPSGGGCEDCWLFWQRSDSSNRLSFYGNFIGGAPGSSFQNARVVITWWDLISRRYRSSTIYLRSSSIRPGGGVWLSGLTNPAASTGTPSSTRATFLIDYNYYGFVSTLRTSLGSAVEL